MFGLFKSKTYFNKFRQYRIGESIENILISKNIQYNKSVDSNGDILSISTGAKKISVPNYYFLSFAYTRDNKIYSHCMYKEKRITFSNDFNFQTSLFNEMALPILSRMNIVLDYNYINHQIRGTFASFSKRNNNFSTIEVYNNNGLKIELHCRTFYVRGAGQIVQIDYRLDLV